MANDLLEDVLNEPMSNNLNSINDNGFNEMNEKEKGGGNNFGNDGRKPPRPKTKKSKLPIVIFILLLLTIIAAAVTIFLLKNNSIEKASNKAEFFEYLSKNNFNSVFDFDNYKELAEKLLSENNAVNTEIEFEVATDGISINNIDLILDTKNDIENKRSFIEATLNYSDNEMLKLNLKATPEAAAFKCEEIADMYIGTTFESFLEEIGGPAMFSGSISSEVIEDMEIPALSTDSFKVYKDILNKNLDDSNFSSKEVTLSRDSGNITATEYALTINETKFINIVEQILKAFESDKETIEAFEDILTYMGVTSDEVLTEVDDIIDSLYEMEKDDSKLYSLKLYVSDGKTVKLAFEAVDVAKLEIDYEYSDKENSITLAVLQNETEEGASLKITNTNSDLVKKLSIEISQVEDSEIISTINFDFNLVNAGKSYNMDVNASYKTTENTIKIKSTSKIDFSKKVVVEELNDTNCVFLDKLTDEEREQTINEIVNRAKEVLQTKMSMLPFIDFNSNQTFVQQDPSSSDDGDKKEEAKQALISKIQQEMTMAINNGEEYTIQNLEGLEVDGYTVETDVSSNLAIIDIDGYIFNIDADFNLSE